MGPNESMGSLPGVTGGGGLSPTKGGRPPPIEPPDRPEAPLEDGLIDIRVVSPGIDQIAKDHDVYSAANKDEERSWVRKWLCMSW